MSFTKSGYTYLCTGTLLNDNDATTAIPYFLTADHCISTQTAASTLTTYWFHRSSSCNGTGYDAQRRQLAGGATLLYRTSSTDTSFLRLNSTPPTGVAYAGWQASTPTMGMSVTGVHSPLGERQKIAFGEVSSFAIVIGFIGDLRGYLFDSPSGTTHIGTRWNNGTVEDGSSGSGLFDNSNQKLIGQLHAGKNEIAACSGNSGYYGRFDLAFNNKLHEFLDPAPVAPPSPPAPSSTMQLRDAVYLYGLPVAADRAKTLVGYNCDVFQILLDVDSGHTDIVLHDHDNADYPDRIHDHAAMFSYALYSSAARKGFGLRSNSGGAGQIGTVTAFGYCFSSRANARALLHDAATGACQLSDKTTVPCGADIPPTHP
ncbi:MAG: serine protease [Azoarcus sp.]|nr:serine protease [Azoarcus sp.]